MTIIIVTREQARLRKPSRPLKLGEPRRGMVVHCTAGRVPVSENDAKEAWNATQWGHQAPSRWVDVTDPDTGKVRQVNKGGRGWPDIAYTDGFNDLGMVLRGREHDKSCAAAIGYNTAYVHFVYQGKGLHPTAAAFEALAFLIDEQDERSPGGIIIGHRDVSSKPCPGDGVYAGLIERWGCRNPHHLQRSA